jgi:hypothetical protein
MDVGKCPECGHELSLEDITSPHVRLAIAAGGVMASAAVADLMLTLPQYDGAREGFDERVAEITEKLHETSDSLSEWGSAYDD